MGAVWAAAALVLAFGSASLLGAVLLHGRRLDRLDPRVGEIVYEDVEKPDLPGVEVVEDAGVEKVEPLYYLDENFTVSVGGEERQVVLVLRGKADRVIRRRDGALHVIDYKSGSLQKPEPDLEKKLPAKADYYRYQLMAYFLMLEQTYGQKPAKAIIDFIDGTQYVEIDNSDEIRDEALELIGRIAAIKMGQVPADMLAALQERDAKKRAAG